LHWAETSDGYTLLSNSIEGYEYAVLDKKQNLIISGKLAHQPDLRSKKEKKFLKKLQKGLKFSDSQIKNSKKTI